MVERLNSTNTEKLWKTVLYGLGAYLLYELAFSVPKVPGKTKAEVKKNIPRIKVWERADGKCEDCNQKEEYLLVGHKNHTGAYYCELGNLRLRCLICETKHHLLHIHKPQKIGLEPRPNLETTYGLLVQLLEYSIIYPEKQHYFEDFCKRHSRKVRYVLNQLDKKMEDLLREKQTRTPKKRYRSFPITETA